MSMNRKAPNIMPPGTLKPAPPPAPPPKRFAHQYRDIDNRDPEAMLNAHEARIAALSQQQQQVGLLEERILMLEEQVGILMVELKEREDKHRDQ